MLTSQKLTTPESTWNPKTPNVLGPTALGLDASMKGRLYAIVSTRDQRTMVGGRVWMKSSQTSERTATIVQSLGRDKDGSKWRWKNLMVGLFMLFWKHPTW